MDIYLDNSATTRVCPEAADMAYKVMTEVYGNPSSTHARGREAKKLLDAARRELSLSLGCQPKELVFTSCGSEADNWALLSGRLRREREGRPRHQLPHGARRHTQVARRARAPRL